MSLFEKKKPVFAKIRTNRVRYSSLGLCCSMRDSLYRGASAVMIIVAIPYALAEVPSLFGREGIPVKDGWAKRLVEFGCWCGFAAVVMMII